MAAAANEEAGTELRARDMVLPESFHRLKRTALLLATALIVMGLAELPDPAVFRLTWMDVQLKVVWVHLLLTAGALYYGWGFLLEVQVARRINSAQMSAEDEGQFVAMLGRIRDQLEPSIKAAASQRDHLGQIVTDLQARIKQAGQAEHRVRADVVEAVRKAIGDREAETGQEPVRGRQSFRDPDVPAGAAADTIIKLWKGEAGEPPLGPPPDYVEDLRNGLEKWIRQAEVMSVSLGDLHLKLERLAPDIARARRLSFWGFECAGVAAPLALGLVLTWFPYVDQVAAGLWKAPDDEAAATLKPHR